MSNTRIIENLFDECLERMLLGGESIDECLRSYPEYADELRPLLDTAVAASMAANIEPSPEFRERARYQMLSALDEKAAAKASSFGWFRMPRWATSAAIAFVLLAGSTGTVAASGSSMPDDFLYPVKLAAEQVQLVLTFTDDGKTDLHSELADRRITELEYMVDNGLTDKLVAVTGNLNTHLTEINNLADTGGSEPMVAMIQATSDSSTEAEEESATIVEAPIATGGTTTTDAEMEMFSETAPGDSEINADDSEDSVALSQLPRTSVTVPGETVSNKPPDVMVGAGTKEIASTYSPDKISRLIALLDKVPEEARSELLKAINLSENIR